MNLINELHNKKIDIFILSKYFLDIHLDYISFLSLNNIIKIPESIIENIYNKLTKFKINNFSDIYLNDSIKSHIYMYLPIEYHKYVSIGLNDESIITILITKYLNNHLYSIFNTIKNLQLLLEKNNILVSFDFIESYNLKINLVNLKNLIDIEVLKSIKNQDWNLFLDKFLNKSNINIDNTSFNILKIIDIFSTVFAKFLLICNNLKSNNVTLEYILFIIDESINKITIIKKHNLKYSYLFLIDIIDNSHKILLFFNNHFKNDSTSNINTKLVKVSFNTNKDIFKMESRLGLWNKFWSDRKDRKSSKCNIMETTIKYLLDDKCIKEIEDWGCGNCKLRDYIKNVKYIGIDGSDTTFQNKIEDLTNFKSKVDAIYLKHVLEHNKNWKKILLNLIESFTKKAVIVIHTPFSDKTNIIGKSIKDFNYYGYYLEVDKLSFSKKEIIDILVNNNIKYKIISIDSKNEYKKDNIFYLEK